MGGSLGDEGAGGVASGACLELLIKESLCLPIPVGARMSRRPPTQTSGSVPGSTVV